MHKLLVLLLLSGCVVIPPVSKPQTLQPGWYNFSVESATISPFRDKGRIWDFGSFANAEPPDVYVEIILGEETYKTPVIRNSYQPSWAGTFSVLLGISSEPSMAQILVWDYDTTRDDPIGSTTLDLNQVVQSGGKLRVQSFGYVVDLSLTARYDSPPDNTMSGIAQ